MAAIAAFAIPPDEPVVLLGVAAGDVAGGVDEELDGVLLPQAAAAAARAHAPSTFQVCR
ncbi:MAG TPA: hypothetical protein VK823_19105 [Streptosporangiaceae bacterium]|nr:hypothetical protein [Streptosporangiaceae bacterium]